MPDRAHDEVAKGRLWRAKEILRGRIADAGYDAALFARYAQVLELMQDDDEAGRFYLLAGEANGPAGDLSRAFVRRRSSRRFAQLWSEMPAAVRRSGIEAFPASNVDLLVSAGFDPRVMRRHLADLQKRSTANRERRRKLLASMPEKVRSERIGLVMAGIVFIVMAVGVVGTVRMIWWGIFALLG